MVQHNSIHLFRFLLIHLVGLWCNTKFHSQIMFKVPCMDLQSNCEKLILWWITKVAYWSPKPYSISPNLGQRCIELCIEIKVYHYRTIQICGILEVRHWAKHNLCNKDDFIFEYWEDILLDLSKLLPPKSSTIVEGSWPSSNWRSNYVKIVYIAIHNGSC